MSIYCTIFDLDDHTPRCKRVKKTGHMVYEYDSSKPCTCNAPPIAYQGSHILPSNSDPRDGDIGFAAIPSHITRDGRDDAPEGGKWQPWLRFHLDGGESSCVVLDKAQVRKFRDALTRWLRNA